MLDSEALKAVKDSPWFWFSATLLGSFLAGFAAFQGLMTIAGRTQVDEQELKTLRADKETVARLQQQLIVTNSDFQARLSTRTSDIQPSELTFHGSGTAETNLVAIDAVSYPRTVKLVAHASVRAEVNGWLRIIVKGTRKQCRSGDFYRNPSEPDLLSGEISCDETLGPGESAQFSAIAENGRADARTVDLQVTVVPQRI